MNRLLLSLLTIWICAAIPAVAQMDDDGSGQDDTTAVDSLYNDPVEPDTAYEYSEPYDGSDQGYGYSDEGEYDYNDYSYEPTFFSTRNGLMVGPTIQFTELRPKDLDPDLSGEFVFFGADIIAAVNGFLLGGGWSSATLYDLSPKYDELTFSSGGFITGYDQQFLYQKFSIRPTVMIGGGGITMIKKRPDIVDSTGREILERYRDEEYFLLRPGISLGFAPNQFFDIRLTADYNYPIGGDKVSDLRKLSYGLALMIGLGR